MDVALALGIALAFAFAATNGLHDASNAIATLVATRAARPRQALALAAVFNLLGPLLVGAAVASAIGGIVTIGAARGRSSVIAAGLLAAVAWNLVTWRWGLPSSSGHALVGGLVGAALVAGGIGRRALGRPRRHPSGRRARRVHRARRLAPARRARRVRARARRAPRRHAARAGAGAISRRPGSGRRPRRSRSATAPTTPRRRSA